MKPLYLLIVDLPLHSSHVASTSGPSAIQPPSSTPTSLLPPFWQSLLTSLSAKLENYRKSDRAVFVSVLLHLPLDAQQSGTLYLPWCHASSVNFSKLPAPIAMSGDPFEFLASIAQKVPPTGLLNLVWGLTSSRISSATALSFRLCQTLRYLHDLQRASTRIVLEPSMTLPDAFTAVFTSLNIEICPDIASYYIEDDVKITLRLDSSTPFSATSIPMTTFEGPQLTTNSWPDAPPLCLTLIYHLPRDTTPLHLLDGHSISASISPTDAEWNEFLPADQDIILRAVSRPSTHLLPSWNDLELQWEYSTTLQLPLGDAYLLQPRKGFILLRRLRTDSSLVLADISLTERFQTPWFSEERHDKISYSKMGDVDLRPKLLQPLWAWVLKQAWLPLILNSPLASSVESMDDLSAISEITSWYQNGSTEDRERFNHSCMVAMTILCKHLQSESLQMQLQPTVTPSSTESSDKKSRTGSKMDVDGDSDDDAISLSESDDEVQFGDDMEIDLDGTPILPFPDLQIDGEANMATSELVATLDELWAAEVARVAAAEYRADIVQSPATSSSGRAGDDAMSLPSSESTNHGLDLLDLIRSRGDLTSSSTSLSASSSSLTHKRAKTSKQLRQELSSLSKPPKMSSEASSNRKTSAAEVLPAHSLISSPRQAALSSAKANLNRSKDAVLIPSKKLPSLASPRAASSLAATSPSRLLPLTASLERASPRAPKLAPLAPSRSSSPAPSNASSSSSSAETSTSVLEKSPEHEADNTARLMTCCRVEVSRVVPATDRRFKDLVQRLFHMSKLLVTVKYDWDTTIPNSELAQRVQEQAKHLLSHA